MKNKNGMTEIVKTVTTFIAAFIFIYGVNIILYGHLSPGGGFAGGVILAFLFILLFIVYGKKEVFREFSIFKSHVLESVGFLGLLIFLSLRFFLGGEFMFELLNGIYTGRGFRLFSAGPMIIENLVIALKVGFSVFIAFSVLALFSRETEND